jgi:hypothetical protein
MEHKTPDCSSQIEAWAVGPWRRGEFVGLLESVTGLAVSHQAETVASACEQLVAEAVGPELVLLAQPLAGCYTQGEVTRLQQLAPLARMVVVAGSWSEGELRTGRPLAGVVRLYWYEFPAWWSAVRRQRGEGLAPPWSAPLDGTLAGRFTPALIDPQLHTGLLPGVIAINCQLGATFEAIREALQPYGADCRWVRRGQAGELPRELVAGIWDGGQLDPGELADFRQFAQEVAQRNGVTLALVDFPRQEHREMVRAAGGTGLLGKPYVAHEMACWLEGRVQGSGFRVQDSGY